MNYTVIAGVNGAGKEIVKEINRCIDNRLSFNQETTLSVTKHIIPA